MKRSEAEKQQTMSPNPQHPFVPDWAKHVVWYQIFPERFWNGDPNNDPRLENLTNSWPHNHKEGWQIHPWTADWYRRLPYENHDENLWIALRRRRYGGDLQGILDRLDYLSDLGVTALYLNPVFEAPSEHKYDGATYHHIDPNFGPDPDGDRALMAAETPHNPATWVWTSADKLALKLIAEVHKRDMRIIFDGVFNHMGLNSWAFRDVVKKQQESSFRDWFKIKSWADPANGTTFAHQGWFDCYELPEMNQDENGIVAGPRAYIFAATERWLAPNGRVQDGIDGWRLDVAFCVAHPFWKAWRQHVRHINPEAYIVGELFVNEGGLEDYLQGDEFDAAMNYEFAVIAAEFFIQTTTRISADEFDRRLRDLRQKYPPEVAHVMQNLFGSHDTARLGTHIANHDLFDYRDWTAYHHAAKAENGAPVNLRQPTEAERQIQKLLAIFQMTYIGAPMIYYGDEAGMWGANDPCCRKPMVWPELDYEPELYLPDGGKRETSTPIQFNQSLFNHYKKLIHIRNSSLALQAGDFETLLADGDVYAFRRCYENETIIVALNRSTAPKTTTLPLDSASFVDLLNGDTPHQANNGLTLEIPSQWGLILRKVNYL